MSLIEKSDRSIYTITVLRIDEKGRSDSRVWFWTEDFERAENAVLNNVSDMFEYYYSHAVIERVREFSLDNEIVAWYDTEYKDAKPPVVRKMEDWSKLPDEFKNTCNWSMG